MERNILHAKVDPCSDGKISNAYESHAGATPEVGSNRDCSPWPPIPGVNFLSRELCLMSLLHLLQIRIQRLNQDLIGLKDPPPHY
jgi:hypothetical protein